MTTEWKERSIRRRDIRHTKISDEASSPKRRKNRRRWCRGVVGVEHDPKWGECTKQFLNHSNIYLEFKCTMCGKILDMWFNFGYMRSHTEKPVIGSKEPLKKKRIQSP